MAKSDFSNFCKFFGSDHPTVVRKFSVGFIVLRKARVYKSKQTEDVLRLTSQIYLRRETDKYIQVVVST